MECGGGVEGSINLTDGAEARGTQGIWELIC